MCMRYLPWLVLGCAATLDLAPLDGSFSGYGFLSVPFRFRLLSFCCFVDGAWSCGSIVEIVRGGIPPRLGDFSCGVC